jgi:hypothetical protein
MVRLRRSFRLSTRKIRTLEATLTTFIMPPSTSLTLLKKFTLSEERSMILIEISSMLTLKSDPPKMNSPDKRKMLRKRKEELESWQLKETYPFR